MPELHRLRNSKVRICMYADDHPPPHVHLWRPEWEAMIDLRTFEVIRGEAPRRELDEALIWIRSNIDALNAKWRELNEREG
jgi:Domain of unknown function (DUF4160)